jgi:tetratricopeptide (TPR) repeat protein
VLKRDPSHPGANHYYIHATEASPSPEKALPSAKRLETLVPSAGHLVHMPAHVYIRTGEYVAAEKANAIAADVDRAYIRQTGASGMYPMMYYNHNVHFESAAAALAGRHEPAKRAAEVLAADVTPAVSEMPTMLEAFLLQPTFVAVRFRKWDDLRAMPDPGPKMPLARTLWLWGRSMAAADQRDAAKARTLREAYVVAKAAVPKEYLSSPQNSAEGLFAVSDAVLDGRIAEASGDRKAAIEAFRRAVAAEDALAYDEPPAWYYPTRESLGGALLRDGRAEEAEKVFREDLAIHPRNPRSLYGLTLSLEAQKKTADAAWTRAQFDKAWKDADTKLRVEGPVVFSRPESIAGLLRDAILSEAKDPRLEAEGRLRMTAGGESYAPSSFDAISLPSTRARIFANAVSRDVERSSPNGEKPQSSVEPRREGSMNLAASRIRSFTSAADSTRGEIGSVTPTNTRRPSFAFARSPRIFSTRGRSGSLASWTKKLPTSSRNRAGSSSA